MIERCFKCDGRGTQREVENWEEWCDSIFAMPIYKYIPCTRCLGAGAVNYEVVKTEPGEKLRLGKSL